MKRFRNIRVHRRGEIDDRLVYQFVSEQTSDFERFIEEVEQITKQFNLRRAAAMSPTDSKLFNLTTNLAKQAAALDQGSRHAEAATKYLRAAEILRNFLKFNKNPKLKRLCEEKIEEYIRRANFLSSGVKK